MLRGVGGEIVASCFFNFLRALGGGTPSQDQVANKWPASGQQVASKWASKWTEGGWQLPSKWPAIGRQEGGKRLANSMPTAGKWLAG